MANPADAARYHYQARQNLPNVGFSKLSGFHSWTRIPAVTSHGPVDARMTRTRVVPCPLLDPRARVFASPDHWWEKCVIDS
jgi:hypothetical protein